MKVAFGSLQANGWGKTFLRHLGREIGASLPGEPRPVLERVRDAAQQLSDAKSPSLPDKQGRMILAMCVVVLAAYRELGTLTGDAQRAYSLVEAAFRKSYQTLFRLMYRALLVFRDPVRVERPHTISTGAETCHCRFVRDPDKRDTRTHDVIDDAPLNTIGNGKREYKEGARHGLRCVD